MKFSQLDRVITQFSTLSAGFVVFAEMLKDEKFCAMPAAGFAYALQVDSSVKTAEMLVI
ncbi:MAG: hypothetical protein ACYTXY_26975 [Nostoc sp.]